MMSSWQHSARSAYLFAEPVSGATRPFQAHTETLTARAALVDASVRATEPRMALGVAGHLPRSLPGPARAIRIRVATPGHQTIAVSKSVASTG